MRKVYTRCQRDFRLGKCAFIISSCGKSQRVWVTNAAIYYCSRWFYSGVCTLMIFLYRFDKYVCALYREDFFFFFLYLYIHLITSCIWKIFFYHFYFVFLCPFDYWIQFRCSDFFQIWFQIYLQHLSLAFTSFSFIITVGIFVRIACRMSGVPAG